MALRIHRRAHPALPVRRVSVDARDTMLLQDLLSQTPASVVFMDCDGVIFDTNALKCDAFRVALEGYPRAAVEALVDYHRRTGGVSRYLKFEKFFREFIAEPSGSSVRDEVAAGGVARRNGFGRDGESGPCQACEASELHPVADEARAMQEALARFAHHCEVGYSRMRPRPEALAFAELFGADRVFVVSGSDENELRRVFERQELDRRFAAIHGSPTAKKVHLRRLLDTLGLTARDALFVGDGWGDWDCAKALEVPFVFLAEMSEWDDGPETVATSRGPMAQADTWHTLLDAARRAFGRPAP